MIRKYLSLFMLLSILFPIGDKAMHDIEHFNEDHCAVKETHYCRSEHLCTICDYVFSSSSHSPIAKYKIVVFSQILIIIILFLVLNTIVSPKYTFTFRGPPVKHLFLKFFSVS